MPRILCIDDNSTGLRARRVLLEKMGHKVTTARSGQEGLNKFAKVKADLVIVDHVMPRMKGDQVLRKIKQSDPKLPVILLSGYAETLGLEQAVPEADCVLEKGPREVPELTRAVTRLLRRRMKKPSASVKMKSATGKEKKPARR
jgi:CheY-like chemotaxis protein